MSDAIASNPPSMTDPAQPMPTAPLRPARLWPAWLLCLMMLVAMVLTVTPSIANRPRFFLMMGAPFLLGLVFSLWVLLFSRLRWKERLLLAVAGLGSPAIAGMLAIHEDALRTAGVRTILLPSDYLSATFTKTLATPDAVLVDIRSDRSALASVAAAKRWRRNACISCACAGVAVRPLPIAHTGS